jgi:hypothetical protein
MSSVYRKYAEARRKLLARRARVTSERRAVTPHRGPRAEARTAVTARFRRPSGGEAFRPEAGSWRLEAFPSPFI